MGASHHSLEALDTPAEGATAGRAGKKDPRPPAWAAFPRVPLPQGSSCHIHVGTRSLQPPNARPRVSQTQGITSLNPLKTPSKAPTQSKNKLNVHSHKAVTDDEKSGVLRKAGRTIKREVWPHSGEGVIFFIPL